MFGIKIPCALLLRNIKTPKYLVGHLLSVYSGCYDVAEVYDFTFRDGFWHSSVHHGWKYDMPAITWLIVSPLQFSRIVGCRSDFWYDSDCRILLIGVSNDSR